MVGKERKGKEDDMLVDQCGTSFGSFLHSFSFFFSLSPFLGFVNYMDTSEFDSWCLGGLRACLKEFAFGFLWVVVCTDDGGWVAFSVV